MDHTCAEESLGSGGYRVQVVGVRCKHGASQRGPFALAASGIKKEHPCHPGYPGVRIERQRSIRVRNRSVENSAVADCVLELLMESVPEPGVRVGKAGIHCDRMPQQLYG